MYPILLKFVFYLFSPLFYAAVISATTLCKWTYRGEQITQEIVEQCKHGCCNTGSKFEYPCCHYSQSFDGALIGGVTFGVVLLVVLILMVVVSKAKRRQAATTSTIQYHPESRYEDGPSNLFTTSSSAGRGYSHMTEEDCSEEPPSYDEATGSMSSC